MRAGTGVPATATRDRSASTTLRTLNEGRDRSPGDSSAGAGRLRLLRRTLNEGRDRSPGDS